MAGRRLRGTGRGRGSSDMDRRQRVPVRRRADSPRCLLLSRVSRAPRYVWRLSRAAVVEREAVCVSGPRGAGVADAVAILPRAPIEGRIAAVAIVGEGRGGVSGRVEGGEYKGAAAVVGSWLDLAVPG